MIDDIYNSPIEISVDEKTYSLEYDNNAYALAEKATGKGLFNIFNLLVVENNLPYNECVEVVCAGLVKKHSVSEIEKVKEKLQNSPSLLLKIIETIQWAFSKPLLPPEIMEKQAGAKNPAKKKTLKQKK